ncbi:MAG: hypothetical protein JKX84_06060 [Flavobacteriales bacterium]|nr:hypothetical protein [Flavobacteriales bacterium]
MQRLNGLVKMLRRGEKRLLRHLYTANNNGEKRLRLELFELIESGKINSDSDARIALGSKQSDSAYSHLKTRLREDILNVLLLQESPKRIVQPNRAAVFECWKKLAQAYVLIFRGAKQEGGRILKSAADLADRYELSAEKVLINHVIREALYSFTDVKQLNLVNENIRGDLSVWMDVLRSEEISFVMTLPHLYKDTYMVKELGFEASMIDELRSLFNKTGTSRIGFWYYLAFVEHCTNSGEYEKALKAGHQFLELVEKSPAVRSKNNIAGVNQTLGLIYLELRKFDEAIKFLARSEKLFPPTTGFNRLLCLQSLTLATTANGNLSEALQQVNTALNHPRISGREHLIPQWLFIQAGLEFLSGDVEASFKTVNKEGYLLKHPDEWNIQLRLLEMLQLIEMKDEDWLDFKLDATRKFLTRHKELDTPRVRAAVDVISNLLRKDLDFSQLSDKSLAQINNCIEEKEDYQWKPSSPELVRFDFWFEKKRKANQANE